MDVSHQTTEAKLQSNRKVFVVLFFNHREVKLTDSDTAKLVIRECFIFWEKARIPTISLPNCVKNEINKMPLWSSRSPCVSRMGNVVLKGLKIVGKTFVSVIFNLP